MAKNWLNAQIKTLLEENEARLKFKGFSINYLKPRKSEQGRIRRFISIFNYFGTEEVDINGIIELLCGEFSKYDPIIEVKESSIKCGANIKDFYRLYLTLKDDSELDILSDRMTIFEIDEKITRLQFEISNLKAARNELVKKLKEENKGV